LAQAARVRAARQETTRPFNLWGRSKERIVIGFPTSQMPITSGRYFREKTVTDITDESDR